MTVLAFCTSATVCSVAVLRDRVTLASDTFPHEMRLLERLVPVAHGVLERAGLSLTSVDAVAADVGPGSFTGIRIGVMTAKALAWALKKDVVGVTALECLAQKAAHTPVVALIRARPAMVYRQAFGSDLQGLHPPEIVETARADEILDTVYGTCPPWIAADPELDISPIEDRLVPPRSPGVIRVRADAETVGLLASRALERGSPTDPMQLKPVYVSEPLIGPPKTNARQADSCESAR